MNAKMIRLLTASGYSRDRIGILDHRKELGCPTEPAGEPGGTRPTASTTCGRCRHSVGRTSKSVLKFLILVRAKTDSASPSYMIGSTASNGDVGSVCVTDRVPDSRCGNGRRDSLAAGEGRVDHQPGDEQHVLQLPTFDVWRTHEPIRIAPKTRPAGARPGGPASSRRMPTFRHMMAERELLRSVRLSSSSSPAGRRLGRQRQALENRPRSVSRGPGGTGSSAASKVQSFKQAVGCQPVRSVQSAGGCLSGGPESRQGRSAPPGRPLTPPIM